MKGSSGIDIKAINTRFEARERAKKLLIELERTSACLANAERLAKGLNLANPHEPYFIEGSLDNTRTTLVEARRAVEAFLAQPE